ncbi:hypothetical protein MPTK1_Vg00610 [Marchantia polymorpha subsp. ruderalis]|uniref:Uncharacterized protein n=1 Tax=Marchantia polymorpha TaxID=3197 RepID=A0A2R6VX80_MARPO|nr:hypothetical protein MARPO_YA0055 [Marchantia polymorpha]BBN20555.1 hypothetical protein Mp_Vg00610 [Marchantia polymorpha subsp. ruderalis]|eukprot:PTQ26205.1 hypothetical protein MARPO_YA0055 [Marchantia polymorpha]
MHFKTFRILSVEAEDLKLVSFFQKLQYTIANCLNAVKCSPLDPSKAFGKLKCI